MYSINQNILDKAKYCDKNFACLTEAGDPSCKIATCAAGKFHFVEKLNRACPYHTGFGHGHICTCPVRLEIFNKYGE